MIPKEFAVLNLLDVGKEILHAGQRVQCSSVRNPGDNLPESCDQRGSLHFLGFRLWLVSPGPIPSATSAKCSPEVQEFTARACGAAVYSQNSLSKCAVRGPLVIHPERKAAATSAISSSPRSGTAKGMYSGCGCMLKTNDQFLFGSGRQGRNLKRIPFRLNARLITGLVEARGIPPASFNQVRSRQLTDDTEQVRPE